MNSARLALGEAKGRILGRLTATGYGEYVLVDDVTDILDELAEEAESAEAWPEYDR